MDKKQFTELVLSLDLNKLRIQFWDINFSDKIIGSLPKKLRESEDFSGIRISNCKTRYLTKYGIIYIVNSNNNQKIQKILYSTPEETYIFINTYGDADQMDDEWIYQPLIKFPEGTRMFEPISMSDWPKIHRFRYRNAPITIQNEGRGWKMGDGQVGWSTNLAETVTPYMKFINWPNQPWSELK